MSRDKVYTSVFPMATIKDGEFADFVPMSRKLFLECVEILRKREIYSNARKQVMYRMNKVLANLLIMSSHKSNNKLSTI